MLVRCNILPMHCQSKYYYYKHYMGGKEGGTCEIVDKLLPSVLNGVNQIFPSLK